LSCLLLLVAKPCHSSTPYFSIKYVQHYLLLFRTQLPHLNVDRGSELLAAVDCLASQFLFNS
jgi:hypothetical protein